MAVKLVIVDYFLLKCTNGKIFSIKLIISTSTIWKEVGELRTAMHYIWHVHSYRGASSVCSEDWEKITIKFNHEKTLTVVRCLLGMWQRFIRILVLCCGCIFWMITEEEKQWRGVSAKWCWLNVLLWWDNVQFIKVSFVTLFWGRDLSNGGGLQ